MTNSAVLIDSNTQTSISASASGDPKRLAPRPVCLADTGLTESFLAELASKHLLDGGILTLADLSTRMALAGPIVESLLNFMRDEARIEVRGPAAQESSGNLRYALTDRGRKSAADALMSSGYVGPAPVPLDTYIKIANAQTVHHGAVTKAAMKKAFADIILPSALLDQLGPSLNSGRAIFIYGPAGTGKTFITQKLVRLFPDETLVPHAISINETVVQVFDPAVHRRIEERGGPSLMLGQGHDPRFVRCRRPVVISGGELSADMLEVQYDAATRQYRAPLQLKANNGLLIIDDMGRQRAAPETIFNRWIVPMEEKIDYLNLGSGRHFSIPFDVVLIFSTNLEPTELADEAFLRRIGYKIKFDCSRMEEYEIIWQRYCSEHDIACDSDVIGYVVHELYEQYGLSLLACHPRDLLSVAIDYAEYCGGERRVTKTHIDWAWHNYFGQLDDLEQTQRNRILSGEI